MLTNQRFSLILLAAMCATTSALAADEALYSCVGSAKATLAEIAQRHADTAFFFGRSASPFEESGSFPY